MIDVTIEAELEGATLLSLAATHPDATPFPFPHHRIAWARVLWSADRDRDAPGGPASEEQWALAHALDAVQLLSLTRYPRVRDADEPPQLRVRIRHRAPLFDFASSPAPAWKTTVRSTGGIPPRVEGNSRRVGEWTKKRVQALAADRADDPVAARAELRRAAEDGAWWSWVAPVFATYDDPLSDLLDHTHQWARTAHPHYDDDRYAQWLRVAAGDPSTCASALLRIAHADELSDDDLALLERAHRAAHTKSVFWARRRHVLLRPITTWCMAQHGDAKAKKKLAAMAQRTRQHLDDVLGDP